MNRKYLPLIILLLIIFTLTILSTILSTILVPAAYLETYYAILFIVFMGCIPTYLIYRRRDILKGNLLLGLRMGKGWYVYGTILSIIFVKYFGLKVPITIREFPSDSDTWGKIERVFGENIKK